MLSRLSDSNFWLAQSRIAGANTALTRRFCLVAVDPLVIIMLFSIMAPSESKQEC
jgi:hypothetical protein